MKSKKRNVAQTVVMTQPEANIVLPDGTLKNIKNELLIGRKDFEDIVSHEIAAKISVNHLRVWCENGEYYIEDGYLGKSSTNGTFLNEKQIKGLGPQKLNNGDVVKLVNKVSITIQLSQDIPKTVVVEKPFTLKTTILKPTLTLFWDDRKYTWKVTDELIVGKEDLYDLLLEEKRKLISAKHIRIFKEDSEFYVEDGYMGKPSTNGTTLQGAEITNQGKQHLKENDEIVLAGIVKLEVKKIGMEQID